MAKSQIQMYRESEQKLFDGNRAFMDMINDKVNPMTREDLEKLIERRPAVYERFFGFLDKLPTRGQVAKESGE